MFAGKISALYHVFRIGAVASHRISRSQALRPSNTSSGSVPILCPSRAASGYAMSSQKSSPIPPSVFPKKGFEIIDSSIPVEEENLPLYNPRFFYPVRLGEVFDDRYQVVAKLGFGASSTVWLSHDLMYAPFCNHFPSRFFADVQVR